jgi:hypothetical protein
MAVLLVVRAGVWRDRALFRAAGGTPEMGRAIVARGRREEVTQNVLLGLLQWLSRKLPRASRRPPEAMPGLRYPAHWSAVKRRDGP